MDMMNMTSSSGTNVTLPVMEIMPFHTAVGFDMLWFAPWMPASVASTLGACVGLFLLAVFYRFAAAVRNTANLIWATQNLGKFSKQPSACEATRYSAFVLKRDSLRGLLEGLVSFVGYLLMLAVMVMNAWFFIAIILGIIVGETSFGRFGRRVPQPGAFWDANECC